MGKSRRKKSEKKDFKKVKLRVGRKVQKTNETKLSFVSKKICIREDPVKEETVSSSAPVHHLSAILPRLVSRHNEELVSALSDLRVWMKGHPEDARQLLLMELPTRIEPLMRHLDSKVRSAAGRVFSALLHLVSACPAYYPAVAQAMFGAFLHFDIGVRNAGWDYLRLVLDSAPKLLASLNAERLLEELSRRAAQERTRVSRFTRIVERLLQTLEPSCPLNDARAADAPERVNDLSQPFRHALFDWDSASTAVLWRSEHIPRAVEQGLGWQGRARYRIANFLSDLAPWLLSLAKEFQCLDSAVRTTEGKAKLELCDRLLTLLSILTSALQHHHFREPLPKPTALTAISTAASLLWQLFPVPEDSPLFAASHRQRSQPQSAHLRLNMALVRLNCLRQFIANGSGDDEADVAALGVFFNDEMGPLWPLPRWLCLHWVSCAELVSLGRRRSAWLEVLHSVVQKLESAQTESDSKVARSCRRVVMMISALPPVGV